MTHVASFNAGIEAAAEAAAQWMNTEIGVLPDIEAHIRSLKRPEPSELDKVSSGAKVILDWFQGDECTHVLSAVTLSELRALAALKAMEGE